MKRAYSILYHLFGSLLPDSYFRIRFMGKSFHVKIGLICRRFLVERIIEKCGKNVNIERGAKFNKNIQIGNNSGIGKNSSVAPFTIIGDDVMMGPEVIMYSRNHDISRVDIPMRKQGFKSFEPITICDDVWIGRRVIILPGVTIGRGSVIGAGAIVCKDVAPYMIVAGNPAKVIKNRKAS